MLVAHNTSCADDDCNNRARKVHFDGHVISGYCAIPTESQLQEHTGTHIDRVPHAPCGQRRVDAEQHDSRLP